MMRVFISPVVGALMGITTLVTGSNLEAQDQVSVVSQATYRCPTCGKIHARPASSVTTNVSATTVARSPAIPSQAAGRTGHVSRVLGMLNAQRTEKGLTTLQFDPQLQVVAERRVKRMAAMGLKDHPEGSIAPGRYEGVGWSSSFSPTGVSACFTDDPRMRFAGAAMATGRDGVYFAVVYR